MIFMQSDEQVVTYEEDNSLKKGYHRIFSEIFKEIIKNRWLIFQFFKRDFFATYKQSFVGIAWAFIFPIISVGAFMVLNTSGILSIGSISVPYPIFAVLGIAFWQLFVTSLISGTNSLVNAGSMIVKINFSKKSLIIASCAQSLVSFSIQMIILCVLFVYFGVKPNISILICPILIAPLFLLSVGLSLILSILNGIMRDIVNILSIILTFLLFLTPVLYSKPNLGILASFTEFNILYYLIAVPRDLIIMGVTSEVLGYLISSIVAVAVFVCCLIIFHLTETRIAERI